MTWFQLKEWRVWFTTVGHLKALFEVSIFFSLKCDYFSLCFVETMDENIRIKYLKERDRLDMVVELKVQYCRETLYGSLIPIRRFFGVQFLNKSVSASRRNVFFTILNLDKTCNKYHSTNYLRIYKQVEKNNKLVFLLKFILKSRRCSLLEVFLFFLVKTTFWRNLRIKL